MIGKTMYWTLHEKLPSEHALPLLQFRWRYKTSFFFPLLLSLPPVGVILIYDLQNISSVKAQAGLSAWNKWVRKGVVIKEGSHKHLEKKTKTYRYTVNYTHTEYFSSSNPTFPLQLHAIASLGVISCFLGVQMLEPQRWLAWLQLKKWVVFMGNVSAI